jgi:transposase InsO family protein
LAHTLQELQAQVDDFDRVYNTQRPHQGLPGRLTPQQAWDATPPAPAPRPQPAPPRAKRQKVGFKIGFFVAVIVESRCL